MSSGADRRFIYAGIGSRKTPADILALMAEVAGALAADGWTLRSGGAKGADQAFFAAATAAGGDTELFLPWARFQQTALAKLGAPTRRLTGASEPAFALAGTFHPVWQRLPDTVKAPARAQLPSGPRRVAGLARSPRDLLDAGRQPGRLKPRRRRHRPGAADRRRARHPGREPRARRAPRPPAALRGHHRRTLTASSGASSTAALASPSERTTP